MAPPDGLDQAKADFTKGTDDVYKGANEAVTSYTKLVDKANNVIDDLNSLEDWWWEDEIKEIQKLFKQVNEKLVELVTKVNKVLDGAVPVLDLFDRAFKWTNDVQGPVSSLALTTKDPATWSFKLWEGPAADAYNDIRITQWVVVQGLADLASGIGVWLIGVGKANAEFMLDLALPLLEFGKTVTAAVLSAVTVVGTLEAIGKLADAIASSGTIPK